MESSSNVSFDNLIVLSEDPSVLLLTPARLKNYLGTGININKRDGQFLSGQITLDTSLVSDSFGQDLDFP